MKHALIFIIFLFPIYLFGMDSGDIQVEVKFLKQTYRLNEPIEVTINIVNNSVSPVTFAVSPQIYETIFFSLHTPQNEEMPVINDFQSEMRDNASASGNFRNIVLLPNESFSRVIDITKWFDIRESGYYYIKGIFYPNPDQKSESFESINYKILIKPPSVVEKVLTDEQQKRTDLMDKALKQPPYDVIDDLLDAKMKKDWERFLMHIDAEKLILSFDEYNNAYENARNGKYKLEVLDNFRKYLTIHWQDRILGYRILKSEIEPDKAIVESEVDYRIDLINYTLKYNFLLYKNHLNQWMVYDYLATKVK